MRVLFVTKPHLPLIGGAQLTDRQMALALLARGHDVTVLCPVGPRGRATDVGVDGSTGYPTLRQTDIVPALEGLLRRRPPDVAVLGGNPDGLNGASDAILDELARRRVPTVLYLHDMRAVELADRPLARVLAPSRFLAAAAPRSVEVEVLPPVVDRRRYAVATSRRTALFVNPIPKKGLATALELAARHPQIPFAFNRCWWIAPDDLAALSAEVRRLPNLELRDEVAGPAALYGDARVLLVPSAAPEGFGRVAREAQCAGIPVIAAATGGLPEAVGAGGVLVDPSAGLAGWSAALTRVWHDSDEYARLRQAALRQAEDPACSPVRVGARLDEIVREAGSRRLGWT